MSKQTVLPFAVSDENSFNSFYSVGNAALVREITSLLDGDRTHPVIYLWGDHGSGKTHLLNACCYRAQLEQKPHLYLPIIRDDDSLAHLNDLQAKTLVCLDDAQHLSGNIGAQEAVFSFYEKVMSNNGAMIFSATFPPAGIGLELKDLESRLAYGGVFNLHKLNDEEKIEALRIRAHKRGFVLEDKVLDFIMTHCDRNASALFSLLEKMDQMSLAEHRKITIPFIKTLM